MRRNRERRHLPIASAGGKGRSTARNFAWAKFLFAQDDRTSEIVRLSCSYPCHSDPSEREGRNLLSPLSQGNRD
jgi:hypothetical protein